MDAFVGTSGFSYAEWNGSFYPRSIKPGDMLGYYAQRLPAVEINNTFYRMPRASLLHGWRAKVPVHFRFAVKAPRRITHLAQLSPEAHGEVGRLWEVAGHLGQCLGPFLFQLPPSFAKDMARLRTFLGALPEGMRVALEVRHPSWLDPEVYETLRDHGAALVAADCGDPDRSTPLVPTAGFGYLRLRAEAYSDAALRSVAARMAGQAWSEVYVFFKHEARANGPQLAARLLELL